MLFLLFIALSLIALFSMGYYFGHQIGSTHHIREELAKSRNNNHN